MTMNRLTDAAVAVAANAPTKYSSGDRVALRDAVDELRSALDEMGIAWRHGDRP